MKMDQAITNYEFHGGFKRRISSHQETVKKILFKSELRALFCINPRKSPTSAIFSSLDSIYYATDLQYSFVEFILIQFQASHKLGNINFRCFKFELEFATDSGNVSVCEDFLNRGAVGRRLSQASVG